MFINYLARLLARKKLIDARSNSIKVNSWLSFEEQKSQDIFTNSDGFFTKKAKFVIEVSVISVIFEFTILPVPKNKRLTAGIKVIYRIIATLLS